MVDVLPRQFGDVYEAVHAAEVDERTEVHDRRHDALANLARLQVGEELVALLALRLFQVRAPAEHDVVAVLVELDDLGLELTTYIRVQVADSPEIDEARRQEAAQPDVEDEAAFDDLDDRALDDLVLFLLALDVAPGALVLGALFGEDQAAVFVFLLQDECFDALTELDDLVRV